MNEGRASPSMSGPPRTIRPTYSADGLPPFVSPSAEAKPNNKYIIPSGATVYLTTHVQLTPESEQKINTVLVCNNTGGSCDGANGCAVKVNPHRYTDTALFIVVYR